MLTFLRPVQYAKHQDCKPSPKSSTPDAQAFSEDPSVCRVAWLDHQDLASSND